KRDKPLSIADKIDETSSWLYGLFAVGYAVPVALLVEATLEPARAHTMNEAGWAPMAAGLVTTYCAIAGVFMLGGALAWGRVRRAFWILPPMWLEQASLQVAHQSRQLP